MTVTINAEPAAYDCPCCMDVIMPREDGGRPPCDDCQAAGCEPNRDGDYDDCRRPCPGCGDPRTADYYLHVTWARADGEVTYNHGYVCEEHLPSEADTPGTFIPSDARVIEYEARALTF